MDSFNLLFILEMEEDAGHSSPMVNIWPRRSPPFSKGKCEGGARATVGGSNR
jgi:hypothetical protein